MSSSNKDYASRQWMYARIDPATNQVSDAFIEGLKDFMIFAKKHNLFIQKKRMFCPCIMCQNRKFETEEIVSGHLFNRGFMAGYFVWIAHGQDYEIENPPHIEENTSTTNNISTPIPNPYVEMATDAFDQHESSSQSMEEEPNEEAKRFFSLLNASQNPIYDGCREGHSQLSLASRCMTLKTDFNLSEKCMDQIAQMIKEYMPRDNNAMASYYETKKLMRSLGLPYMKIDVCQNNCMIFWKTDADLESCRFCGANRFKGTKELGKKQVPFQRMFYLPIADRLKRLYQSNKTASFMRWHKEHYSTHGSGVMCHPSDGEAWKRFNQVHPDFANEPRNVYLGLCTDGFNPFGRFGQNYSLWPVIMTPYNLPLDMCMKREFLFLTILVPGPNHPKKSLDVFLQPLIDELNCLWNDGVQSYDVSMQQNFTLRAMLLWTISDFPAYAMLSGWTTHGRLACPYCMGDSGAFWLKHGRKTCWFDCHRRFLPKDHSLRRNKKNFIKNKIVDSEPPKVYSGDDLWRDHVSHLPKTVDCGGVHPKIVGYGEKHNWHKQSIFWELPYWKSHLLRHNLDVMHIEKNFFDNIINTLLNVQGKTKDNVNSRLDLAEICNRKKFHMGSDGKAPFPSFGLSPEAKTSFFNWLKNEVKFPDGYASNISSSVDINGGKLSRMKSHDNHVFMQRLLPIAFAELLGNNIHQTLSGIGLFFRDLCTRTLEKDSLGILKINIAFIMCNLEKLFPPSFFDVMEHLAIHLPYEAELGGPVQFRWMYPFERYMSHLKKKAKNKAKIEGSIVEQYVNEEISDFSSYYFEAHIQTKNRNDSRNNDGDAAYNYPFPDIPEIFVQSGRGSGKAVDVWLDSRDYNHAHSYVLLNCSYMQRFESLFEESMKNTYSATNTAKMLELKELYFASWLRKHIQQDTNRNIYPIWLHELVYGPATKVSSWPMFFCRGYNFHTIDHGKNRKTFNYGICVKGASDCDSPEEDFYGVLTQIFELYYPEVVGLRVVLFRCDWYDSTKKGLRINNSGIVDVNRARRFGKYDPFILASQADQVCFVSYPRPRLNLKKGDWYAAIKIQPRGNIISNEVDPSPLQCENDSTIVEIDPFIEVDSLAEEQEQLVDLYDAADEELDSKQDDISLNSETTEDDSS